MAFCQHLVRPPQHDVRVSRVLPAHSGQGQLDQACPGRVRRRNIILRSHPVSGPSDGQPRALCEVTSPPGCRWARMKSRVVSADGMLTAARPGINPGGSWSRETNRDWAQIEQCVAPVSNRSETLWSLSCVQMKPVTIGLKARSRRCHGEKVAWYICRARVKSSTAL